EGCAFGATGSATTLALLGDSHASHWLAGLERAGQAHGWRIEPFVAGACPVADLRGLVGGAAARPYRPCARSPEATLQGCGAASCETERGGMVLFSDDNHLTRTFSQSLAVVLGERLEAALER